MAEDVNTESVKDIVFKINPGLKELYDKGKIEEHVITYDSLAETLEPIYFWILDFMNNSLFPPGKDSAVEKLIDNFSSSPTSGHFQDIGLRGAAMQKNAQEIMATINTITRSVLNIIYDLREFQIRLGHYKSAASKDKSEAESGLLSLKQIWLDSVDIKKGTTSLKGLVAQFPLALDAFLAAEKPEDIDKLDLNERIRRLVKPRVHEFLQWKEMSEKELRKRYQIERDYLKSQVASLEMYGRWVKPYLKTAEELRLKETTSPALVKAFNIIMLELALFGKKKFDIEEAARMRKLPYKFLKRPYTTRKYYSCILVDFKFRGVPYRATQRGDYTFGGRAEMGFTALALDEDEIAELNKKLKESDRYDALKLIEGMAGETLDKLREDIEFFLKEEIEEKQKAKEWGEGAREDVNPFLALFGFYGKKKEKAKEEKPKEKPLRKDTWNEEVIRAQALASANENCFVLFDTYKKAHGMPSHLSPYD